MDATVPRLLSLDSLSRVVGAGLPAVRWHHPIHPDASPTSKCFDPTPTGAFASHTRGPCPRLHARTCTFDYGYANDPSAADACPPAHFTDGGTHPRPHAHYCALTRRDAYTPIHVHSYALTHGDVRPQSNAPAGADPDTASFADPHTGT